MASNYSTFYVKVNVKVKILSAPAAANVEKEEDKFSFIDSSNPEILNFGDEIKNKDLEEDPSPNPPAPVIGKYCDGQYFLGIRLNTLIYENQQIRNALGLFLKTELTADDKKSSIKKIRNYSDAAALDVVSSVYVTFVAKQAQQFYAPWGPRHRTYVVFDARLGLEDLARILYTTEFQVGTQVAIYTVEPDSIKVRRSRKTAVSL